MNEPVRRKVEVADTDKESEFRGKREVLMSRFAQEAVTTNFRIISQKEPAPSTASLADKQKREAEIKAADESRTHAERSLGGLGYILSTPVGSGVVAHSDNSDQLREKFRSDRPKKEGQLVPKNPPRLRIEGKTWEPIQAGPIQKITQESDEDVWELAEFHNRPGENEYVFKAVNNQQLPNDPDHGVKFITLTRADVAELYLVGCEADFAEVSDPAVQRKLPPGSVLSTDAGRTVLSEVLVVSKPWDKKSDALAAAPEILKSSSLLSTEKAKALSGLALGGLVLPPGERPTGDAGADLPDDHEKIKEWTAHKTSWAALSEPERTRINSLVGLQEGFNASKDLLADPDKFAELLTLTYTPSLERDIVAIDKEIKDHQESLNLTSSVDPSAGKEEKEKLLALINERKHLQTVLTNFKRDISVLTKKVSEGEIVAGHIGLDGKPTTHSTELLQMFMSQPPVDRAHLEEALKKIDVAMKTEEIQKLTKDNPELQKKVNALWPLLGTVGGLVAFLVLSAAIESATEGRINVASLVSTYMSMRSQGGSGSAMSYDQKLVLDELVREKKFGVKKA